MRDPHLTLKALALAAAVTAATPAMLHAAPAPSAGFVYRSGSDFYLRGKKLTHVGANQSRLVYFTTEQMKTTLDHLESVGIRNVRVFLPNSAMNVDQITTRLTNVLNEAAKRDIYVTVALTTIHCEDMWAWEGGGGKTTVAGDLTYCTRAGVAPMLNDTWVDWAYQLNYKPFAVTIAQRFKDNRAVFAWDIANEVNLENPALVASLVAFYRNMAAAIKAVDPNHMVTTGMISTGTGWSGMQDAERDQVYNDANIDYVTVHQYNDGNIETQYDDIWRANYRWGKPVIVEESGFAPSYSFSTVENYFQKQYDGTTGKGSVDAINIWAVVFTCPAVGGQNWGGSDTEFSPCNQGPTVLDQYKDMWQRWAAELDRRNGGTDLRQKLVQPFWRSGVMYTRRVPVSSTGDVDWANAHGWVPSPEPSTVISGARYYNYLPGSGNVQAYNLTRFPSGWLMESLWRGNQGFYRSIPTVSSSDWTPRWAEAGGWGGPISIAGMAGSGDMQDQGDYVVPNGLALIQSYWRGNQGFWRSVPMDAGGNPAWGSAGAWSAPIALSGLPGTGSIVAKDDFVIPNGTQLIQAYWRDSGYSRYVPISASGSYGTPGAWGGPYSQSSLPGWGTLQAQASYFTRH